MKCKYYQSPNTIWFGTLKGIQPSISKVRR
jgi:hypothetical protein